MKPRYKIGAGVCDAMEPLDQYVASCGLEESLLHFVRLRASQLNGCAYCIDMHWKDLRAIGENEQRLYGLDAWRESPYYSARERAALVWTESVTLLRDDNVADAAYAEVSAHFSEKEVADLTCAIATINAWNRLSIASRVVPGTYQPASTAQLTA